MNRNMSYEEWSDELSSVAIEEMSYDPSMWSDDLFSSRDLGSLPLNFERGMSGTTWWGRDKEGNAWALEEEGRTVQWYKVRESGSKDRVGTMTYSKFKEMF